ncbi:MAG: NUDIX domain-containing protein [Lachnospiraceae bacterium]|nr:NUDIX domain-containing protein [Lachnospiraceae bacterium]MBR7000333.1 NUDIX domain-containing protein [Lachnospiraceae bacterium]
MNIFTIVQITDPDYGCEETRRPGPAALLKLCPDTGAEANVDANAGVRYFEVPERVIAEQGLAEGKKVTFGADGAIRKYVRVVAAVIRDPKRHPGRIFATARGYGEYKGWWEFPGGKIEAGETPEEAIVREIREELAATIRVSELFLTVEYDYERFHLSMDCFYAEVAAGKLTLREAAEARWLAPEEFGDVRWLPADREVVERMMDAGKEG